MLGNRDRAQRKPMKKCLELEPENVFSLVRLGVFWRKQDLGLDEG